MLKFRLLRCCSSTDYFRCTISVARYAFVETRFENQGSGTLIVTVEGGLSSGTYHQTAVQTFLGCKTWSIYNLERLGFMVRVCSNMCVHLHTCICM